ncbi:hypothetical protein ACVWY2_001954 [Bradyrhizobium sp. JR6.1]
MSATTTSGPANTASTLPSRRLRTPTLEAARVRLLVHPGTIADALHPAADRDMADHTAHFFRPRNSPLRALVSASRITRLVSSDEAMPFRFFGEVPSRSAFNVS